MSDISHCSGEHWKRGICPKRDSCKRYLETLKESDSYWQPYIGAAFIIKMDGVSCEHYKSINHGR